jgi:hypothetical protein
MLYIEFFMITYYFPWLIKIIFDIILPGNTSNGKLNPKWKAFGIPIAGHSFTLISLVLIFFNLCMWDKGVYIVEIILKFDWLGLEITMQFWRIHLTMFVMIDEGTED